MNLIMMDDKTIEEVLDDVIFHTISDEAGKLGVRAFVIGGFVRDFFLGRLRESHDIDVVVEGSGMELAKAVAKSLNCHAALFKNFGTAQVKFRGTEIEFVGARKESYRRDSRKPIVEDGTLEEDQLRRDFTINAMAFSLQKENYGELVDPFGGIRDLNLGMATGLDKIYPEMHESVALKMVGQGALLTDFGSGTEPFKENFVRRNRIIAGMSDAVLVVESKQGGGSMLVFTLAVDHLWLEPKMESYHITPYQTDASLKWKTASEMPGEWIVAWKAYGDDIWQSSEPSKSLEYSFTSLNPGTIYDCKLSYTYLNVSFDVLEFPFSTVQVTSKYPAIAGIPKVCCVGDSLVLRVFNVNENVRSISWEINGSAYYEETYPLTYSGLVSMAVTLKYSDNSTERITRNLTVKQKDIKESVR